MDEINIELSKLVIRANPNYNLQEMGNLQNAVAGLDEKVQESFFKRSRAMQKQINFPPYENWFLSIGDQLLQMSRMVNDSILSIYPKGAPTQYLDAVVFELAGYQMKNVKKVCEHAVRTWDGSKALPPVAFWLKCITAVKSQAPQGRTYEKPKGNSISAEEKKEVQTMMRELCDSLGVNGSKEGSFHNETTLIRHYGILQNLNKGLRQIDGGEYEWVNEWETGDRRTVDHRKTLELFNSGRISEKEAKKAWEKSNNK